MLEKKRRTRTKTVTKSVPLYNASSKEIDKMKKNVDGVAALMEASKEGGAGKGGRGR